MRSKIKLLGRRDGEMVVRAATKLNGQGPRCSHRQGFALPPRAASAELGWPATAHSTAASWTKKRHNDHQRIHLLSRQDIAFTANCPPQIGRTVLTAAWAAWTDRGGPPSGSAPSRAAAAPLRRRWLSAFGSRTLEQVGPLRQAKACALGTMSGSGAPAPAFLFALGWPLSWGLNKR